MFSYLLRLSLVFAVGLWPFQNAKAGSAVIKPSSYALPSPPEQYAFIKILIQAGAPEVTLSAQDAYSVLDEQGRVLFQGKSLAPSKIQAVQNGIWFANQTFAVNALTIESPGHGIRIKGALYRQALEVRREAQGTLMVINVISIEDYLKGVLPSEVNPSWPMESLKAQAIASRTYALSKMIENQAEPYHLSKDVLSQVYGGKNLEHSVTTQAVEDTQGQILVFDNKVFPAYFHSTCGGRTTQAEFIWDIQPHPSLAGVECNFCWKSKHYRWSAEFSRSEIQKKLNEHGLKVAGFQDLRIGEKDASGRAKNFILRTASGDISVRSNDFRLWISPQKMKSTWITLIERTKTGFLLKGRGWGHGVGLCQYGTKQLGEIGYPAQRILNYYYPGAQVVQYWAEMPRSLKSSVKGFFHGVKEKLDLV